MIGFKSQWAKSIDYSTVVERTYRDDIVCEHGIFKRKKESMSHRIMNSFF